MGRPKQITDEEIRVVARRFFLEQGVGVPAADIARELGVSHTTLFNRFGSKEALMIAALGPPERIPWVAALETGPDERPVRVQLEEHGKVMCAFFNELQRGMVVLRAAGISFEKVWRGHNGVPPPVVAVRALADWLKRAQSQGRLAECDVETLTVTILGSLHNWAFTTRACGDHFMPTSAEHYVEQLIALLWQGIGVDDA